MAFNPVDYVKTAYQNSPWVVISVAFHVVLGAAVVVFTFKDSGTKEEVPPVEVSQRVEAPPVVEQPPEEIERKAVPKNEEAEIVDFTEEYVPTEIKDEDLHLKRGDPTAAENLPPGATGGTSIGVGIAPGHYGTGVPSTFASRRAGPGGKGRGGGAVQATEAAVLEGMKWLIRHQQEDGGWSAENLISKCSEKGPKCVKPDEVYNKNHDEGLTALSLLCFLGAGYDNTSKQNIVDDAMGKRYYIGQVIKNGLTNLKDKQNEEGSFTSPRAFMYNEALAALVFSEAYGMTSSRAWKDPAQKAINFLVNSQKPNPSNSTGLWGWRYASKQDIIDRRDRGELDQNAFESEMRDADTSVTTWVVMALKSASLSGLDVPQETMDGALSFIDYVSLKDGRVGYLSPDGAGQALGGHNDHFQYHTSVMSALGMLTRTFVSHDIDDPKLEAGAKLLVKDLPEITKDKLSIDYYYWYYGSLALNQFDGPESPRKSQTYWNQWNERMKECVLQLQDKNTDADVCTRGGWLTPDRWTYSGSPIYCTAINVLTLEVYYRYGNAFTGHESKKKGPSSDTRKKDGKTDPKPADPAKEDGKGN
ncbi:MAG: hypothetical protein K8S98_13680 [Planctomycetes bacterium]|nr:hypothetical protein [Planctomycetota bacterium]